MNKYFDSEAITKLYPGASEFMVPPMLIHASTDSQLQTACESGKYFAQLKKDGALYTFVKTEEGSYLFGRTVSKVTGLLTEKSANVPHIIEALNCLPNGTMLVGEIYYPGGTSKNTTPIMGCLPDKAIARQNGEYGQIHYYVHDVLAYEGVNYIESTIGTNWFRYNTLVNMWENWDLGEYDFLELAEAWDDNLYARIAKALANGEEGMVLKLKNGYYEPGKRPMTNWKAKKVDALDAVIIGFESPTYEYYGKELDTWEYYIDDVPVTKAAYYGWNNSRIKLGAYSHDKLEYIGIISSGISDAMKEDMTAHPDKYLGHVCKIQCMEKDNLEHTLRHGFFLDLRDDKDPSDCKIQDIFG